MKTFSPYISIILDEEDFEAEQICRINKFAEVRLEFSAIASYHL